MIGVFDSGIAGLQLSAVLSRQLPGHKFIFFGDTAGTPIEAESTGQVQARCQAGYDFLVNHGARLILLACNRSTVVAADSLNNRPGIPLLTPLDPVADAAVKASAGKRFGILGTRTVVDSGVYQAAIKALSTNSRVYAQACPLLIPLIEEGWYQHTETKMILRRYLRPLKNRQIDTLIVASSHLQLLLPLIVPRIGRRIQLIDSFSALANAAFSVLATNDTTAGKTAVTPQHQLFVTRRTAQAEQAAARFFGSSTVLHEA